VLIERNKRRTGSQAGLEANNMVGQLRDEFISTTKGFKDILKVRSERMKERNDRQSEVLGFDSSKKVGGGGEDEMEESLLGNRPKVYEEKMMAKSQSDIRIRLTEGEDEELDDEEYDEDLDEDCLNRRHVKYNSEQIVDKQVKKMKKRAATKKK